VTFISGFLNNSTGHPIPKKDIISITEEDAGILWKHVDFRTGRGVVTRSHRLVIAFIATIGNYEYIFNWEFYQDGSIHNKILMTGICNTNLLAEKVPQTPWGTVGAKYINLPFHQHFFAARLDMEVDGTKNLVHYSDVKPVDHKQNPYGQGFTTKRYYLRNAKIARTKISPLKGRVWVTTNPGKKHPSTKKPVGWKLMPANSPSHLSFHK
jgi:primary-amine oxidase